MICFTDYLFIPSPPVQTVQVLDGSVFVAKPLNCLTKLPEDFSWGTLSLSGFYCCCFLGQHRSMVATRLNRCTAYISKDRTKVEWIFQSYCDSVNWWCPYTCRLTRARESYQSSRNPSNATWDNNNWSLFGIHFEILPFAVCVIWYRQSSWIVGRNCLYQQQYEH